MGKLFLFCLAGVLVLGCTASCKSRAAYQDERSIQAFVEHYRVKNQEFEAGKNLTLEDCINAGISNTLAARFRSAMIRQADPQAAVEILGMLPSLRFQDGLAVRSEAPRASVRRPGFYNVDFMIGLLDFGLGYWYTRDFLYETAYREQLIRKVAGKIQYETARSYYEAGALASVQRQLEMPVEKLRMQVTSWKKTANPALVANVFRKLGSLEQSLYKKAEAYKNACSRLRSLMGLYPIPDVTLADQGLKAPAPLALPELSLMEQIALNRRPELFMGDMQKKVSVDFCQVLIRELFPELKDRKSCSPADCSSIGARALYDLLQTPDRYAGRGAKAKERIAAVHSYAGALAVMAQVRMAYNEYETAMSLYAKDKNALKDCETLLKKGRPGTWEYADMTLDTLQAKLRLAESAMRCRIAGSRILYAMGISKLDDRLVDTVREEVEDARKAAEKDLRKAHQQYNEKQVAVLTAELKKLQKEDAERIAAEKKEIRQKTNAEIDKKYGPERNPAFWENLGKIK